MTGWDDETTWERGSEPVVCRECDGWLSRGGLRRHRATIGCAIRARLGQLAFDGFAAYAHYGPPGVWLTRTTADRVAPLWPAEHRIYELARMIRINFGGSAPQGQWFLRSPIAGVDINVLLHEIEALGRLARDRPDDEIVAAVLDRDEAAIAAAHGAPDFGRFWGPRQAFPVPSQRPPDAARVDVIIETYDDPSDTVTIGTACSGETHRVLVGSAGVDTPDHRRQRLTSAPCLDLASDLRTAGFRRLEPLLVARWLELRFAPYEALRWSTHATSFPTEAAEWRDAGLTLTQARVLLPSEIPWTAAEWKSIFDAGLSPRLAMRMSALR